MVLKKFNISPCLIPLLKYILMEFSFPKFFPALNIILQSVKLSCNLLIRAGLHWGSDPH